MLAELSGESSWSSDLRSLYMSSPLRHIQNHQYLTCQQCSNYPFHYTLLIGHSNLYWRLSENIKDYQRISKSIGEYQRISENVKDYQRISKTIREYQRLSENIREYQRLWKTIEGRLCLTIVVKDYDIFWRPSMSIHF